MNNAGFDIITFDCYGTLIDWESGIVSAFQREAANDNLKLEREQIIAAYMQEEPQTEAGRYRPYKEVLAETALAVARRIGWHITDDRAGFLSASLPGWQPFPDTNAALERLARRFELGILSNIDDDLLAATRRHFTVEFSLIVTAEQVKSYKPGYAHFQEAARRLEGKKQLHAAQSYFHDITPADRLGIPNAWVNRNGERATEGGPYPTFEVSDLRGLADLLSA